MGREELKEKKHLGPETETPKKKKGGGELFSETGKLYKKKTKEREDLS